MPSGTGLTDIDAKLPTNTSIHLDILDPIKAFNYDFPVPGTPILLQIDLQGRALPFVPLSNNIEAALSYCNNQPKDHPLENRFRSRRDGIEVEIRPVDQRPLIWVNVKDAVLGLKIFLCNQGHLQEARFVVIKERSGIVGEGHVRLQRSSATS